jgi:hypothetical protein
MKSRHLFEQISRLRAGRRRFGRNDRACASTFEQSKRVTDVIAVCLDSRPFGSFDFAPGRFFAEMGRIYNRQSASCQTDRLLKSLDLIVRAAKNIVVLEE